VCDACQIARATVESESGFFLCDGCEGVVVIAFQEFELPSSSPIGDWRAASVGDIDKDQCALRFDDYRR
jgi:hypothetical protein